MPLVGISCLELVVRIGCRFWSFVSLVNRERTTVNANVSVVVVGVRVGVGVFF